MLKKIPVGALRLGMHIHAMCGSWIDHPFWGRSGWLLRESDMLHKVLASGVTEVVIDTRKGLDVTPLTDPTGAPTGPGPEAAWAEAPVAAPPAGPPAVPPVVAPPPRAPAERSDDERGAHERSAHERAWRVMTFARGSMQALFEEVRLGKAVDARECLPVVDDIARSVAESPGTLISLVRLKSSDDYTYMHSVAVCALMVALSRTLGLDEPATREAGLAGLVHDLGKALMPPEVLNKPGRLTPEEFAIMRTHPQRGHALLVEGGGASEVLRDVCLHHHERMDGKGYPEGLAGAQISLMARMGAVCDVYDAITSDRPYKPGWDPAGSLQKMAKWAREGHFDEPVFQAFVKSIGIFPVGSLVKLDSGRLAVVVSQAASLLQPWVKVFFDTRRRRPLDPVMLDLSTSHDRIVSRESPAAWGLGPLDPLWLPDGMAAPVTAATGSALRVRAAGGT